ncbi:unnamed protein product [Schistosoma curassoni]|uniref:Signal peptidase II n=1 Tax=Schistosoma curassoni TaxID=6186 RepID=A0A183KYT9_9TREM|nr:unnamed protein product [Schistosoma curassoni]
MWSILALAATSAFSASAGMLSGPAALALLIFLMAMLISSIDGGLKLIGRSVGAASMLGGFSGAGRFKSSLKVFHTPVSLFFNVGDYLAFLAFHWLLRFTVISRKFLCRVTQLSHVSFSCSLFRRHC